MMFVSITFIRMTYFQITFIQMMFFQLTFVCNPISIMLIVRITFHSRHNIMTNIFSNKICTFFPQACLNPRRIRARRIGTRQEASLAGVPQIFANFDLTVGFQCVAAMQSSAGEQCFDYEVQICCPGYLLHYRCSVRLG